LAMAVYYKAHARAAGPQSRDALRFALPHTARAIPRPTRAAIHASGAAVTAGYAPATLAHAGSRRTARHTNAAAPTREPMSLATGSSDARRGATTAHAIRPSPVNGAHDPSTGHAPPGRAPRPQARAARGAAAPRAAPWGEHAPSPGAARASENPAQPEHGRREQREQHERGDPRQHGARRAGDDRRRNVKDGSE